MQIGANISPAWYTIVSHLSKTQESENTHWETNGLVNIQLPWIWKKFWSKNQAKFPVKKVVEFAVIANTRVGTISAEGQKEPVNEFWHALEYAFRSLSS